MRSSLLSSLRCVQINLHHSRSAALHLSQLILVLDVDVILIQEPYAARSVDGAYYVKYGPKGYFQYHSLNGDHAYGSAILAKNSLDAALCEQGAMNAIAGIRIDASPSPLYLFSAYCRFSLPSSAIFLQDFLGTLPVGVMRDSVFAIDCNGKNKLWNSSMTDRKGSEVESLLVSSSLAIANVEIASLDHAPLGFDFVDITALCVNVEYWHFPNIPSLSDHPYIMFRAANSRPSPVPKRAPHNSFPNPSRCDVDLFKELLTRELEFWPVSHASELTSTASVDNFLDLLVDRVRRCAVGSRNKEIAAMAPPKMPWWTTELWLMRRSLLDAFRVSYAHPTPKNLEDYRSKKTAYQRELRASKTRCWNVFCSRNLGGDIFNELDKIANPRTPHGLPASLVVGGVQYSCPDGVLRQFSNHFQFTDP